jgi:murein DD-endopeptidase MepM/ murein hydrolase activator NlpD
LEGEQLWLARPVPSSGPAWTDKTYPYSGTRGGTLRPHTGVEFVVPTGTPVLAVAPGTVVVAGDDRATAYGPQTDFYGNLVIVQLDTADGSPVYALYGHLSEVQVVVGQAVNQGETLGLSGESGVADGPHLHFEVRLGANEYGATRNPLLWLTPLPGAGVVAGRVVGPGGDLLAEAPVTLQRVDGPAPYTATASYAVGEPNADGALGENFVIDDVAPGFYRAVVADGARRFTAELWVYPDRVNWVEIVVGS